MILTHCHEFGGSRCPWKSDENDVSIYEKSVDDGVRLGRGNLVQDSTLNQMHVIAGG